MVVRDNLRTRLVNPDLLDLLGDTEPFEEWEIEWQQRFSDMKPGESFLFHDHDTPTLLGQQCRYRRSGGSAADNENVAFSSILHS
jgi:hypothetical protein